MIHNKYNPKSFKTMIGSKVVLKKLQKYINDSDIPHCLLFYGERGCGKSSSTMILANSIPNSYIEIIDVSTDNGVEVSRDIARRIKKIPIGYKNKIYILEEIHNVSDKFYDALLLVTNDPPSNVYFMIVTTEISKVRSTIRSRFIDFKFTPPVLSDMKEYLEGICEKENIDTNNKVLTKICKDNSNIPRDCLTDLEKIVGVPEKDQLEILERETPDNPIGFKISQLLAKQDWNNIEKILRDFTTTSEIEPIRRTILSCFKKRLLSDNLSDNNKKFACDVINEFEDTFFDSGISGLCRRLYDLC